MMRNIFIDDWMDRGRLVGLQQGIAQGLQQGEHKKAVETAREMLADCMPLTSIAKYTGLSIEELQNITTQA